MIQRGDKDVATVAENYFCNLFKAKTVSKNLYEEIFRGFSGRVIAETNEDLIIELNYDEIRNDVFSIGPHRAPGPDGFTGVFYQHFWNDINPAIIREVKSFFAEGYLDQTHSHTNLCLLAKVDPPPTMSDFRPIALCNVSYKIISKILVNKLKKHLDNIISENQAAFIPGRMITDNVIIAHEIFHALKARKRQSKSYMALKTYIMKAYDRL